MPCPAEYVFSSCYFHHLRNPVAAYVKWIEPFQAGYAWTGGGLRGGLRRGGGDGRLRVCGRGCGRDGFRCGGRGREGGERCSKIVRRRGADVAEIWRDDKIGSEGREQVGVHCVNAFAARDEFAHLAIDFGGGRGGVHAWLDQRGLAGGFGREITFVRDADDLIADAEGVENFRGRRKQRDDSHGDILAHADAGCGCAARDKFTPVNCRADTWRAACGTARDRRPNWR